MDWPEGVAENKVSNLIAFYNALGGVEVPMDAHVNPALRVVEFRVGERIERLRREGSDDAVNIFILAVPFIRNKRKFCIVPEKFAQDLEQGTRGFWSEVQQLYENRICTSLPSSLRIAWNGVLKPRHFLGVRLAVRTMSWISSSETLSMSI